MTKKICKLCGATVSTDDLLWTLEHLKADSIMAIEELNKAQSKAKVLLEELFDEVS